MRTDDLQIALARLAEQAPIGGDLNHTKRSGLRRRRNRIITHAASLLVLVGAGAGYLSVAAFADDTSRLAAVEVADRDAEPTEATIASQAATGAGEPLSVGDDEATTPTTAPAEPVESGADEPPAATPSATDPAATTVTTATTDATTTPETTTNPEATTAPETTTNPETAPTQGPTTSLVGAERPWPDASLDIIVTNRQTEEVITYSVLCNQDGATATDAAASYGLSAEAMCLRLVEPTVQDRLLNGPTPKDACTNVYGWHTASVIGTLQGVEVAAGFQRSGCGFGDYVITMADILIAP